MIPEKPDVLIRRAARRAALLWGAGEALRKKLEARGVNAKATQKAIDDLAEAMRSRV